MNHYDNVKTVPQPRNLKVELYPHQLASIYRMEMLEQDKLAINTEEVIRETIIGILADQTGYGKTLSIIGLIVRDRMVWDLKIPHTFRKTRFQAGGMIKNHSIKWYDKIPTTLILSSNSILHQWETELGYSDLICTTVKTRKHILDLEPENYDVILVTPGMYNKLTSIHSDIAWKRFIFDEPGQLKIPKMKTVTAGFYWFISATPNDIVNLNRNCRNGFMKSIIESALWHEGGLEYIYSDMIIRNEQAFVKASFEMPSTYTHEYICFNPIFNVVKGLVSNTINNMIVAGNIKGAISALGGGKTNNVVELIKHKMNEELEEIELKIKIYTTRHDEKRKTAYEKRRKSINTQLKEINKRFNLMLESSCPICLLDLTKPIMEPKCQNVFCGKCLFIWLEHKNVCPLCRANIDKSDLIYIDTEEESIKKPSEKIKRKLTKSEQIVTLIKDKPKGKFLVFSSYDDSFETIYKMFEENDISYTEIKGVSTSRKRKIDSYKYGDTQVIFLNSNFNGAGLNLQETTDIILYHEMTSTTKTQIIGRANRIGRTKYLHIHNLLIDEGK
jgi:hypothetical protein